ncbi:FeoB-associated Cys-rich membrane protein [Daejeonella sp.]|uniref:FeoB-associated Cys-rich membrane protein n=1 Tax=Daejeonella sp. TaxID=2805397 RepID=UPI003784E71B
MDIQLVAIFILFALALLYVGKMAYNSMKSKAGCASNCGKCSADFSNPEQK